MAQPIRVKNTHPNSLGSSALERPVADPRNAIKPNAPGVPVSAPTIAKQPAHTGVGPARLEAHVFSNFRTTHQWQTRNPGGEGEWTNVSGGEANTTTLHVPAEDPVEGGGTVEYRLVSTNAYGSVTSDVVEIDVPSL